MKILVTGLNGLIGWNLFRWGKSRFEIQGTYRKNCPRLNGQLFHRINLSDDQEVIAFVKNYQPDVLIHSWGMCDLDVCESFPQMAYEINVLGTKRFIEAARQAGSIKKIIYVSTDHVFCGRRGRYRESDEPSPRHAYGRTKHEAEREVARSGLPFLIIRPGLVIGPSVQGNKGPRDFLLSRIRAGKPTHYFTDEWRSPIPAEQLAERVFKLIEQSREGIYHIAGNSILNRFDLACKMAADQGLSTQYIFPRLRSEDEWAHIRPEHLTLASEYSF